MQTLYILPHLHVVISKVLCDGVSDIREAVKFGALFKHANRLFWQYHQICLSTRLLWDGINKENTFNSASVLI